MKHYVNALKETRVLDRKECDLCGVVTPEDFTRRDEDKDVYLNQNCSISGEMTEHSFYPECGGDGEYYSADFCWNCFSNHVVPALEQIGAKVKKEECSW